MCPHLLRPKKTLANWPALEICCWTVIGFSKENATILDIIECSGAKKIDRCGRLLSIKFGDRFQFIQSFYYIF
jgi:hypothetical protein